MSNEGPADLTQSAAEEIRAMAARRGLTQSDIADALGRSQSYVSRALKGGRSFDVVDLGRLAVLMRVPPSKLLGELGDVLPARAPAVDLSQLSETELLDRYAIAASAEGTQTAPPPLPQ